MTNFPTRQSGDDFVSDFKLMPERKKEKRRRKDIDLIKDNDEAIAKMIAEMRLAGRTAS